MIFGLGIDMIEVDRINEKISKASGFLEYVFSEREIVYCEEKTHKFQHYAACFAGKEAFLKALGTGWTGNITMKEIEILHDDKGKPFIVISGDTGKRILQDADYSIQISLTHLEKTAAAVVVIEKK